MFPDLAHDDVFRLETRRLWLRWPRPQDAAAIAREARDPLVATRARDIPYPYPEGAAAEFILTARRGNARGDRLALVLALKTQPGEAIGSLKLWPFADATARLCFWLGHRHWSQGLMSEAVRAVVDLAFGLTELQEISASVPGLNPGALRVLVKSGFLPVASDLKDMSSDLDGEAPVGSFCLDRRRWSSDYGRRAADAQNAMSVVRA